MNRFFTRLALILVLGIIPFKGYSTVRYVKPGDTSSAWATQSNVYADLQLALADAQSGDEIWIAAGVYKPTEGTDPLIAFELVDGVKLYGGFDGSETDLSERNWILNKTILSGDIGEEGIVEDNSYTIVRAVGSEFFPIEAPTEINGLIIEKARNYFWDREDGTGGGLYCEYAALKVNNVIFQNNITRNDGGGAYIDENASVTFGNTMFIDNLAYMGAGVYNKGELSCYNCLWYKNETKNMNGRYTTSIANQAVDVYTANSSALIVNSIFCLTNLNSGMYQSVYGEVTQQSNLSSDNLNFVDIIGLDFRLSQLSEAVDAGDNNYQGALTSDYSGGNRIQNGTIDIGPFEGTVLCPTNTLPEDNAIISATGESIDVQFDAEWSESIAYAITRRFIQYWNDDQSVVEVDVNTLTYLQSFNTGQKVNWRFGVETENNGILYSSVWSFNIPHTHPIYVQEGKTGDGSSWADAFGTVQEALSIAVESDQIWIAAGTYKPSETTERFISYELKESIKLYGGFDGTEEKLEERDWIKNKTILSGDIGEEGQFSDNSYNVVVVNTDKEALLDGVIIQDGNADNWSEADNGGAVFLSSGHLKLVNTTLQNNHANDDGGAIFIDKGILTAVSSIFEENDCSSHGGAIYNYKGQLNLINCVVTKNYSNYYHGSIGTEYMAITKITNSIILDNSSQYGEFSSWAGSVTNSYVEPSYSGTEMVSEKPLFVNSKDGDYRLRSNSSALDKGINDSIPNWVSLDFYGNARILDDVVDLGIAEGGIVCPVNSIPLDQSIFRSDEATHIIDFEADWTEGEPAYTITKYFIEYWDRTGVRKQVEVQDDMKASIALNTGEEYQWRAYVETEDGVKNYASISELSLAYNRPVYVKEGAVGDGSSWTNAYGSLAEAITNSVSGDSIWVAAGTYYPTKGTERRTSFKIESKIVLQGGFAGDETLASERDYSLNKTILSGDIGEMDEEYDNSHNVIHCEASDTITIDGVTIKNGNANYYNDIYRYGAAIYVSKGHVIVKNSIIEDNFAERGAALYNKGGTVDFYNNLIHRNESRYTNIYSYDRILNVINCTLVNNICNYNGGVILASGNLTNSILWSNKIQPGHSAISNIDVDNSIVQNYSNDKATINSDPLFMDAASYDYRLHYTSPAIDKAIKDSLPESINLDLLGNERVINEVLDMGAYEGGVETPLLISPKNKEVITATSEAVTVDFSWEWAETMEVPAISSYSLLYWEEGGDITTIDNITETNYSLTLTQGKNMFWRVAIHIEEGSSIYTLINQLYITHKHPLFVKESSVGDGTAWSNAFGTLNEAILTAVKGDTIWMASGTYYPSDIDDRYASFNLKDGIAIYGGFEGNETLLKDRDWNRNKTILSGDIGEPDVQEDNSYHILRAQMSDLDSAFIDGVTLTEAYADSWNNDNNRGGGLLAKGGYVEIVNSIISDNYVSDDGAAIYVSGAKVRTVNSMIINNSCGDDGGGIYSYNGSVEVINSIIYGNYAGWGSGGIYGYGGSYIANSIIWNNRAARNTNNIAHSSATYSCIEGGYYGEGNIGSDPMFIDVDALDFRLNAISPCINAGNNDSIPTGLSTDLLGNNRILEDSVDVGCFEGGVSTPICLSPSNNAIIKGVFLGTEVEFEGGWAIDVAEPSEGIYKIEYWREGSDPSLIDLSDQMSITTSLGNGHVYYWRIGHFINDELPSWSPVNSFSLTHEYSLKVENGSSGNGARWQDAFGTLQDALEEAVAGDEIWIAAGTYYPSEDGNRGESFTIDKTLSIYGGFSGSEVYLEDRIWRGNRTILSGNIGLELVENDNSNRIITANLSSTDTLLIDGLEINDGRADSYPLTTGAGMYITSGKTILRNVTFSQNYASADGGAISVYNGNLDLHNCVLHNNETGDDGGALHAYFSDVNVKNTTIVNNKARYQGASIYSYGKTTKLTNSIVWGNNSENYDGDNMRISSASYSCIENYNGTGNVSSDPLFVDIENNNYRLTSASPCINAGMNDSIPDRQLLDLDAYGRVAFGTVDMGAYEAAYPVTVRPADKAPEKPGMGGVLGYTWTLGADIDGNTPDPVLMEYTDYRMQVKVWEKDNPDNVYEELSLGSLGFLSFNVDYGTGYQWQVGVETESYTYWSDTATFYVGREKPFYVKAGSRGFGSSWDDAMGSIKDALAAAIPGDEIWVAEGMYYPTAAIDRSVAIELDSYIGLYGGFKGNETSRYARLENKGQSILSGDIGTANDDSDNSNHIIKITGTQDEPIEGVVIDGFTISHANADTNDGGAIIADNASYKVYNCFISHNKAGKGAAIYNIASKPYIYNTQIDNNSSSDGVVYSDANSEPTIINTTITANASGVNGAGTIGNTIIYGNDADQVLGSPEVTYSCIEGDYEGEGNTAYDPDFIDAENNDFRLGEFSSCFDQGSDLLLPTDAFMDLYVNESRSFYSAVDIGASELGVFELGEIKAESNTPANDATEVDYASAINVIYNKDVEIADLSLITMTPENLISNFEVIDNKISLIHSEALSFDEVYTIEIPAEAVKFKYNDKFRVTPHSFSFSIRSCESVQITPLSSLVDACFLGDTALHVTLSGDYTMPFDWSHKGVSLGEDFNESMRLPINGLNASQEGTYVFTTIDMCGNTVTENIELKLKETNLLDIQDKWNSVLFIDNGDQLFEDYQWFVNNAPFDNKQYLDLTQISGNVHATALDTESGCTVYSDTISISNGGLKSVKVAPNPASINQTIVVQLPENANQAEVKLYDMGGVLVSSQEYLNSTVLDFEKTNVKPGIYILEITSGDIIEKRKIMIKR